MFSNKTRLTRTSTRARDYESNSYLFIEITIGFVGQSGFQGSSTFIFRMDPATMEHEINSKPQVEENNCLSSPNKELPSFTASHITMTYSAIVTLLTLGDDLKRLDRHSVLKSVAALQNRDGRYVSFSITQTFYSNRFITKF